MAMVDSDKGITNLHVPSDVIIDASMPAMIRTCGHMWGPDGEEADTLAVIPDSSYAGVYQTVIDDCRAHGAFDPATMGSVPNVGLMAQAAEEYGSHDKTFEIPAAGTVQVVNSAGDVLIEHDVAAGRHLARLPDQGRPDPRLGQAGRHPRPRLRRPGGLLARREPRPRREPDRQGQGVPRRARHRRPDHRDHGAGRGDGVLPRADPQGRGHHLGDRQRAARLQHRPVPDPRARHLGEDALRRPADERRRPVRDRRRRLRAEARAAAGQGELPALGQPRRVLRPGALASSCTPSRPATRRAKVLADTLDRATGTFLNEDKSPTRRLGGIDNRGSHFYLALYWAQELANQTDDAELAAAFKPLAETLAANEQTDRRRADRRAGLARRHRWLLPPRRRQGGRR